jgi:hypothetical protein
MCSFLHRAVEQIFPFVEYLRAYSRITTELKSFAPGNRPVDGPAFSAVRAYCSAKPSDLEEALAAEHVRAAALDEKTFKHAGSMATALAVASAATTAVAQLLTSPAWKVIVTALTVPAIFYVMIGGFIGIAAAARTLPGYGTGVVFRLEQDAEPEFRKPYVLAEALACQERMNNIRVARNEAAFMCIRNGFLFVGLAVCAVLLGALFANKFETIEPKIWSAAVQNTYFSHSLEEISAD